MAENEFFTTIRLKIKMRDVYDLLIIGMECGSYSSFIKMEGSWKKGWRAAEAEGAKDAFAHVAIADRYEREEDEVDCDYDQGELSLRDEDRKLFFLTDERLIKGVQLMADLYPDLFSRFAGDVGNCDACDGDVFIQLCCFKEVIYG